jgi:acetate kinase
MNILVINAGSSSLKYQLIDMQTNTAIARGLCERVGSDDSFLVAHSKGGSERRELRLPDHRAAVQAALDALLDPAIGVLGSLDEIDGVGHRVVHGGEAFSHSVLIDDEVLGVIDACSILAPLHNPAALAGIKACRELVGKSLQIAVFDTAFHQTMPPKAWHYPLPTRLYEQHRIRRYGFHGTSHRYVSQRAAEMLGRALGDIRLITCHLGNGCSIAAIDHGRVVDTSMGFTPLEGLMMGTRCGSIDPAIVTFLIEEAGMSAAEVNRVVNKESGLLGVSGLSNDLRDVQKAASEGNGNAALAVDMYAYSVRKHIGAYAFAMGGCDAVVMTAGVGENSASMRRLIFAGLEGLGVILDDERNEAHGGERVISGDESAVALLVIPTNEELMIAMDAQACMAGQP